MKFTKTKLQNWQNYFSNLLKKENSHLSTILKDIFIVSTLVWATFTYLEYLNPGLISQTIHFIPLISIHFLPLASIIFFILLKEKNPQFEKKIFYVTLFLFLGFQLVFYSGTKFYNNLFLQNILEIENYITVFFAILFAILIKKQKISISDKKLSNKFYYIVLAIITIWTGFLIFYKLGRNDFFHDEIWHVSVIESLRHGEGLSLWDFTTNQPATPYTRGIFINYFGYFFSKLFGYSEFSLRFFPALIGVIIIPLIYFVFKNTIGRLAALITAMGFSFNFSHLFLARFLRPYTTFLLFYLLFFYFYQKVLKGFLNNEINKKLFYYILLSFLSLIFSIQTTGQSRIVFIIIPIHLIFVLLKNYKLVKSIYSKKISWMIALPTTIFFLFFIFSFDLIPLAKEHLSFKKLTNPTLDYWDYLFIANIKSYFLFKFLFLFGLIKLLFNDKSKIKKSSIFVFFGLIPLIFLSYFLDRYEDFRYIHFAVSFLYGIAIYGMVYFINLIFNNLFNIKKATFILNLFSIIFSLLLIFYPVLPIKDIKFLTKKSPSLWDQDYEQTQIHRRAVAPEFKKAYKYLNENQKEGDFVIISDGQYYLEKKDGVNYFILKDWKDGRIIINNKTKEEISLLEITNQENVYFVDVYFHLLNNEVKNFFLYNCKNISENLNIKKYNYIDWYKNKNLFWPNLFLCKN